MEKLPISPPSSNFPSDVLKWMKKNAAPKMALKLMQICKYFQHQEFPYFVCFSLHGGNVGFAFQSAHGTPSKKIYLEAIKKQLWITQNLYLANNEMLVTTLLPKLAVCDITNLNLSHQENITFEQFKILTSAGTVREIQLGRTVIMKDEKSEEAVALEDLFMCLPNLRKFKILSNANTIHSHQEATKNMPPNLQIFDLHYVTDNYKLEECIKFILDNKKIQFILYINNSVEYIQKHQKLIDNLIENWSPEYPTPKISFIGLSEESKSKLIELKEQHENFKNSNR